LPAARIDTVTFFRDVERDLKASLLRSRSIQVFRNAELKLYGRVGESEEAFRERCVAAAGEEADREAAKLRDTFERKMDRVQDALARAEDRVEGAREDARTRGSHEVISIVGDVLGAFLGGKASAGSIAGRLGRSAKGASSR